jgi:hypothetical protein
MERKHSPSTEPLLRPPSMRRAARPAGESGSAPHGAVGTMAGGSRMSGRRSGDRTFSHPAGDQRHRRFETDQACLSIEQDATKWCRIAFLDDSHLRAAPGPTRRLLDWHRRLGSLAGRRNELHPVQPDEWPWWFERLRACERPFRCALDRDQRWGRAVFGRHLLQSHSRRWPGDQPGAHNPRRPDGTLWFGHGSTGGAATRYDGKSLVHFTTADGLPGNRITQVYRDRAGTLWLASEARGLARFDERTFTHYGPADGLGHSNLTRLFIEPSGLMWIGTGGGGLSRFDGTNFVTFTTTDGLGATTSRASPDAEGVLGSGPTKKGLGPVA